MSKYRINYVAYEHLRNADLKHLLTIFKDQLERKQDYH